MLVCGTIAQSYQTLASCPFRQLHGFGSLNLNSWEKPLKRSNFSCHEGKFLNNISCSGALRFGYWAKNSG
jgi:hypothetical protein